MLNFTSRLVTALLLTVSLCANSALAWGPEGHRIVAMIAAAHLLDNAKTGVRSLLESDPLVTGLPAGKKSGGKKKKNDSFSHSAAMAAVANWADDVKNSTKTNEWHFIDLAASDQKAQIASRCAPEGCVTSQINAMKPNLKPRTPLPHGDKPFTPTEELKFIIHLMGDLHQPLHCATNADAGGNCLRTAGFGSTELHAVWDGGMIRKKFLVNGVDEATLAKTLDTKFSSRFDELVKLSDVEDMACVSHTVAFQAAYGPLLDKHLLKLPEPRPFLKIIPHGDECALKAPDFFNINPHPKLVDLYNDATFDTVRLQLAAGGYRLAALLNAAFQ